MGARVNVPSLEKAFGIFETASGDNAILLENGPKFRKLFEIDETAAADDHFFFLRPSVISLGYPVRFR